MAYTLSYTFRLDASGLTLTAQYVNTAGANVGSAISSGFVELGNSWYQFVDTAVPDAHRGSLLIKQGSTIKAAFSINPQETENADIKTSAVSVSLTGSGANSVTVTVQSLVGAAAIVGALVTVKNSAETAVIAYGYTNASGQVAFNLNAATYKVLINAGVGYETLPAQTLVVDGTETVTYTLSPQAIIPPVGLSYCRLYGYLKYPDGTAAASVKVRVRLNTENAAVSSGQVIAIVYDAVATTDSAGYFQIDLVRSDQLTTDTADESKYLVMCEPCNVNVLANLNASTKDLASLV